MLRMQVLDRMPELGREGAGVKTWSQNRLVVVGPTQALDRFKASQWQAMMRTRHAELLETSVSRFACQFETDAPPIAPLQDLSCRWPELVFLFDYEVESNRTKGVAKAKTGKLDHWSVRY